MIRFLTAGESHGPSLTGILDGIPAGLELSEHHINEALARRQVGYGSGGRMKIEKDTVRITSGLMNGKTTGAPITLVVENRDFKNWKEKDIKPIITPRPGHADLTGAIKYGYRELRLSLERSSARETTMRVAVGAVCKQFLAQFGVIIGGYVTQIGDAEMIVDDQADFLALYDVSEQSDVRCPDPEVADKMREAVDTARKAKDTLGGIFELFALNVPVGLGSHVHWDKRLEAKIVSALVSIQAMKGAEIGRAFENASKPGSEVHDNIDITPDGTITRRTNRAGGFEGGITTGEPIIARVAMKPIATMLRGAESVNLATGQPEITTYERSDFCAVPRAVPVGEAMLAIVLADALLEKLGGDSIEEMMPRFASLKKNRLEDVPMDNVTWRFGYE